MPIYISYNLMNTDTLVLCVFFRICPIVFASERG